MQFDLTSFFRMAWVKVLLAVIGAIVIGFIAYAGYQYSLGKDLSEKLPQTGETIAFTDSGIAEMYLMSEFSFSKAPLERIEGISVLESVILPGSKDSRIVLGQKDGTRGVILGSIKGGSLEVLLADGTNKSDLVVTPEGIAVFAVQNRPALFPEQIPTPVASDDTDSAEPEETGSASGPVPLIIESGIENAEDTPSISGGLFGYNLETKELYSLGAGKSPRAYGPNAVIAIAPEGVVVVDSLTASRVALISYRGGDSHGSALSPNGTIAAVRREGSATVEFFRITDGMGIYLGQIFSASPMYGTAILGEGHIFVRTGKDTVALYTLSEDVSTVQPHIAELGLLMPN
jgi:hypothetical protein